MSAEEPGQPPSNPRRYFGFRLAVPRPKFLASTLPSALSNASRRRDPRAYISGHAGATRPADFLFVSSLPACRCSALAEFRIYWPSAAPRFMLFSALCLSPSPRYRSISADADGFWPAAPSGSRMHTVLGWTGTAVMSCNPLGIRGFRCRESV